MTSTVWPARVEVGSWTATRASGELSGPDCVQRLEPKLMDLLCLLASEPGRVWSRDELLAVLWPGVVVGDDSLARAVSKLRQALRDDAKSPLFIETIAKRGYRWIAESTVVLDESLPAAPAVSATLANPVAHAAARRGSRQGLSLGGLAFAALGLAAVALLGWNMFMREPLSPAPPVPRDTTTLLTRADHYYFQFSRADNEAALELYQRVLGLDPDNSAAMAGMANALAQRAIRWPSAPGPEAVEFVRLGDALATGTWLKNRRAASCSVRVSWPTARLRGRRLRQVPTRRWAWCSAHKASSRPDWPLTSALSSSIRTRGVQ